MKINYPSEWLTLILANALFDSSFIGPLDQTVSLHLLGSFIVRDKVL